MSQNRQTIFDKVNYSSGFIPAAFSGKNVAAVMKKQASTTPTWQTTNFTYTRLNHVATVTDPLSRVTTYAYDDNENLKTVTDNNSKGHELCLRRAQHAFYGDG